MTEPTSSGAESPQLPGALTVARDWVADYARRLGWHNLDLAFAAQLAGLHTLRDALPRESAILLGLALPTLVRGFYFEGWRPHGHGAARSRHLFLEQISERLHRNPAADPDAVAWALLQQLSARLAAADVETARLALPEALHALWPAD